MRFAVLSLLLFSLDAFAQCLSVSGLEAQIQYCTENTKASHEAETCGAEIDRAWKDASRDLASLAGESGQRLGYGQSQEKYDLVVERVLALIAKTEQSADLVARYPTVMVDGPGITNWSESLPCYRQEYNQISHWVSRLDRKAAEGRKVLAGAKRLRSASHRLAKGVGSRVALLSGKSVVAKGGRRPAVARPSVSSDITGLKKGHGI
ncbi:MAG TPA: hypothetical protein VIH99_00570 [Bdellovibrionota bacterium]|jgi:hypothetical protein